MTDMNVGKQIDHMQTTWQTTWWTQTSFKQGKLMAQVRVDRLVVVVLVTIREVEKRNGIGSTNQYSVDCLLVSMTRYWSNFVADLNKFKILDRLFLVNSSVIIFTVLNHLDLLIEVKINFDSFHNWEMIKIGVTLLGSGLHKPTGTFHDFVLWNIHWLFGLLGPWIPD